MRSIGIARTLGFFCMAFSLTMLLPMGLSLWYADGEIRNFSLSFLIAFVPGLVLWLAGQTMPARLRTRDGFLIVGLFWIVLSILGAWPFILGLHLGVTDAVFEAASAITTTGATVISGLDDLPRSVLFYRQQLQWFGGMGLIVLAIAVLPALDIGGMHLYRAETPGPMKEEKLAPRLEQVARSLWFFYIALTAACALAYWMAGMNAFDAVAHSLSTVSTGGFSTYDDSLGYFSSPLIESIAILFMLMGAINFSVHFLVWQDFSFRHYLEDIEVRTFLLFVLCVVLVATLTLYMYGNYESGLHAFRDVVFEVVSVVTSTGFGTVDFSHWPLFLPVLLIFISFVGGCGGSTAGGMKIMRMLLLIRQGYLVIRRLVHPRAVIPLKIGGRIVHERTMQGVWGFFSVYIATFLILMLAMMATGLDHVTSFSAVATCMNNLGPGLGDVTYTFAGVSDSAKIISTLAMLLGRLEVFTLLVLLSPAFWRE